MCNLRNAMKNKMKTIIITLLMITTIQAMANQETNMEKTRILVLYHSDSGNTAKLAQELAAGVKHFPNVETTIKSISQISPNELSSYDGIAFGAPVYFGAMSGEMKTFLDKTLSLWKKRSL